MALAAVWAAIEHLLLPSSPTAVPRFVIALVVDPIQRQAVRTRPHVCEKVLEAVPATANGDPAPAISCPVGARRIRAPAQHALPGVIRASAAACCLSVAARHTRIKTKRRAPNADNVGSESKLQAISAVTSANLIRSVSSGRRGSNPQLRPWEGRTLPLSYSRAVRRCLERFRRSVRAVQLSSDAETLCAK